MSEAEECYFKNYTRYGDVAYEDEEIAEYDPFEAAESIYGI